MALTKVSGGILDPGINVAGIVTATGFDGPFTGGSSSSITAGIITATGLDVNGNGDISGNLVVGGNLTANGDFTTLNTTLREVELLRVDANSSAAAGIITQTGAGDLLRLYDGASQVVTVDDTGKVGIGSEIPNAKLRVHNNSDDSAIIWVSGADALTEYLSLGIQSGLAVIRGGGTGSTSTALSFETSTAGTEGEKMRLDANGILKLGTSLSATHVNQVPSDVKFFLNSSRGSYGGLPTNAIIFDNQTTAVDAGGTLTLAGFTGTNAIAKAAIRGGNEGSASTNNGYFAVFTRPTSGALDERLRITSAGKVCIAHTNALHSGNLQVSTSSEDAIDINAYSSTADEGGRLSFYRSKNASIGSNTIVADGDSLGRIDFRGYNSNGNSYNQGATIEAVVDGEVGTGGDTSDMPSALVFKTSTNGTASPSTKVRIADNGAVLIGGVRTSNSGFGNKLLVSGGTIGLDGNGSDIGMHWHRTSGDTEGYIGIGDWAVTGGAADDFGIAAKGNLLFGTSSDTWAEKMRIQDNGQVCIGKGFVGGGGQLTIRGLGVNSYAVQDYQYIGTPSNDTTLAQIRFTANTSGASVIQGAVIKAVADAAWSTSGDAPTRLEFHTVPDGSASMENRMTITKDGQVIIDGTENLGHPNMDDIVVGDGTGNRGITIASGTSNYASVAFGDSNDGSGSDRYEGLIEYYHNDDSLTLYTSHIPRLRIDSDGIDVTGEVAASQDYPNFRPTLDFNFAATKKLKSQMTFSRTGVASFHDGVGSVKFVGDNVPRFEHDILTGECKGLMVEGAGTNYSWHSRRFYSGASGYPANSWVPINGGAIPTITENTHTAPDGTSSGIYMADTITGATGTTVSGNVVRQQWTSGTSVKHTVSIYVKLLTATQATIYLRDANTGSTQTASAVNIKGWQRLVVTSSSAMTASVVHSWFIGNTNGTIAVWGSQIERSDYVTSYIKTEGGVDGTRVADQGVQLDGEDFTDAFNDGKGTLIAEFIPTISLSNQVIVGLHQDFGSNNRIEVRSMGNNAANARFESVASGSSVVSNNTLAHAGINNVSKYAFAVEKDNYAMCVNGSTVATDTSGAFPSGINSMIIGDSSYGVDSTMIIKRIMYYADRLPNSQLVTLTS